VLGELTEERERNTRSRCTQPRMNTDKNIKEQGCSRAASCDWMAQSFRRKDIPAAITVSRPERLV